MQRDLDCCRGIEYDCDGRRWIAHETGCQTFEILMDEGLGMAGRETGAVRHILRDYPQARRTGMLISADCETGGLEPTAPLLQLTLWQPNGPCFDERIRADPAACHPRALQANGLDPTVGGTEAEVAAKLVTWWKGIGSPQFHLIGQNVGPFDVPFMKRLTRVGVDVPWGMMFDYHYRDVATLALAMQDAGILHFGKWSLTNICQVLGILYDPHICRADAKAAWYAWHRLAEVLACLKKSGGCGDGHCPGKIREHLPALDLRG